MKRHIKQYALWAGLALCGTGLASADTLVTFQVDMTQQIALNAFTPGVNVVNARGTFNGWGTFQLTNNPTGSNPNLYTGTVDNTSDTNGATMEYKYCIDSGGWENAGCGGDGNRTAVLPATSGASLKLPINYFGDAEPPAATPITDTVTFQVDLTEQIALGNFTPGTSTVYPLGDFEGWSAASGTAMTNDPTGPTPNIYSITLPVTAAPEHLGHYKFYIDTGSNWENPASTNVDCTGNRFWNMTFTGGASYTLPLVYFGDVAPAPPVTNTVSFQVDMSIQANIGHFDFNNGDTVECRGSFNSWGGTMFALTNDPTAANSNLFSGTLSIVVPPTGISYKFWDSNPLGGWEQPASTGGNNRSYTLPSTTSTVNIPAVFFSDMKSDSQFALKDTLVMFTVCMTNSSGAYVTDTTGHTFDPSSDSVWLNGDFANWWAWAALGGPPQYQMTNNPVGSPFYTLGVTIPKGNSLQLTYKYSVGGNDNEMGFGVNHIRFLRQLGNYSLPTDTFAVPNTEPSFGPSLNAARGAAGHTTISWLGRPGVHLQTKSSLSGPWQDLFNTDGTNWSNGYMSTNGLVSVTNWPSASGSAFFRLINP